MVQPRWITQAVMVFGLVAGGVVGLLGSAQAVSMPILLSEDFADGGISLGDSGAPFIDVSGVDCAVGVGGFGKCQNRRGQLQLRTRGRRQGPSPEDSTLSVTLNTDLDNWLSLGSISFRHRVDGIGRESAFDLFLNGTELVSNERVGLDKRWTYFTYDLSMFAPAASAEFTLRLIDLGTDSRNRGLAAQMMIDDLTVYGTRTAAVSNAPRASVPVPASLLLMLSGVFVLLYRRQRM